MYGGGISNCKVIDYAADGSGVMVMRSDGQILGYPVQIGFDGPADGLRIHQKPLPVRGSWGLVAFPDNDLRNGVWLRTYLPGLQSALNASTWALTGATGGASGDPNTVFQEYQSHWSGYWRLLDAYGQVAEQWPDGSYTVVGSGTTLPTVYRQIVDQNNNQKSVAVALSDRLGSGFVPSSPFNFLFRHASGSLMQVVPAGSTTVSGASGASLTVTFGGSTVTMAPNGNVTVAAKGNLAASASGTASVTATGALTMSTQAGATISAASTISVTATGNVSVSSQSNVALSATAGLVSTSSLILSGNANTTVIFTAPTILLVGAVNVIGTLSVNGVPVTVP